MKRWLLTLLLLCIPFTISAETFEEELHYFNIDPAQPGADSSKIRVIEFFLYSCPHCFKLEPHIKAWLKTKPENVEFVRIPATFNRDYIIMYAKTFYALEQMGKLDQVHDYIFHVLQVEKKAIKTQAQMEAVLADKGIDIAEFQKQMKSFAVNSKVNRARSMADKFDVTGVPSVSVAGKYRVAPLHGASTMAVTKFLIKEIHKERLTNVK